MQPSQSMFRVPPFPAFPAVGRYVNLGSMADALQRVVRSVDAREALSLVVGPPGIGKSLLCNILAEHFRKSHEVIQLGETPIENRPALLRRVLHALGVKLSSVPDGDLQLALIDRVCDKSSPEGGLLIIVDEAQSLPAEVLEAIRMTTNIMRRGEPRVSAVVCGGPHLDETLASPAMQSFAQRIATRCYLHPLSNVETRQYIREAIERCGADPRDTITDEAISAVHHACCGVPRLINQLMTQAVDCAEEHGKSLIGIQEINNAWSQLQQLPSPMLEEPTFSRESVEFGELEDMPRSTRRSENGEQSGCDQQNCEQSCDAEMRPNENLPFEDDMHSEQVIEFPGRNRSSEDYATDDDYEMPETDVCITDCEMSDFGMSDCEREQVACDRVNEMAASIESIEATDEWICEAGGTSNDRYLPPPNVSHIASSTPLPSALFGDFDDEEQVPVGLGIRANESTDAMMVSDLETMLHEEIVGLSSDMQLFQFPDTDCDQNGMSADEGRYGEPITDDLLISEDDSDILIIEDDMDVQSRVEPPSMRREESTISLDFQAMLTRMRSNG